MKWMPRTNANERRKAMNVFLKAMLRFALCYAVGVLPASADIPNHHIFYRSDKRAPLTKIEIVFLGAGSNQEQPSQTGLAQTVAKLFEEVAKKQGYWKQLETLGTSLYLSTHFSYQKIVIDGLSEHCAKSIEIVRDLIYDLEFSDFDLQYAKKQKATDYRNDLRKRTSLFMKNFALAQTNRIEKYGEHKPLKTVENLSLADIRQYADLLLKTEVVFFKVISDRDSTEVAQLLRPLMEERQTGGFVHSLARATTDSKVGPTAFVFTNYEHSKNTFCYWVIPCGSVGEENYIPNMISRTLGQYGTPRLLYKYFREELGLVYGIQCDYSSTENVRYIEIYADPQLHNSDELIRRLSEFLLRLPDDSRFWDGIQELRESRNVAYAHVHEQLTPQRRLANEVYGAIYNPPSREGGYKSVTDEEVRAFLKKYFVSQNLIMIFVGPKDHVIDILNTQWPEAEVHVQSVQSLIE